MQYRCNRDNGMNRRKFLESFALGTAMGPQAPVFAAGQPPSRTNGRVKRVLVMFKCHFDLGFIDTQAGVVRKYFEHYYPQAIQIAQSMRQQGADPYVWTTGSWLLY